MIRYDRRAFRHDRVDNNLFFQGCRKVGALWGTSFGRTYLLCFFLFPELTEKPGQQLRAFLFKNAPCHLRAMIEGQRKHINDRPDRACLEVGTAVNHAPYARIDDSPGAHGAGLKGNIQLALPQPPAAELFAGFGRFSPSPCG